MLPFALSPGIVLRFAWSTKIWLPRNQKVASRSFLLVTLVAEDLL